MLDTFDIYEAADYLKCSDNQIKVLINKGIIKAARFGKHYVLLKEDLAEAIRANYTTDPIKTDGCEPCQSTNETAQNTITLNSRSTDRQYNKALKPKTAKKQSTSKQSSRKSTGKINA